MMTESYRNQRSGKPEETSQRMCEQRKGMETTEREGLEIMNWTEEQATWSAGKAEN